MDISDFKDIQALLDSKIEESMILDYKRQLSSNKEIAKDLAAFANTEGGTIIYGVIDKDRKPMSFQWLSDKGIEEKIQDIASNNIQPKLSGVVVIRFDNPDKIDEALYVVEVPKSPESPHMANERYYRRSGSTSRAMDNIQVKNAMLGSGRFIALKLEIETNEKIMKQAFKIVPVPYNFNEEPIVVVPFNTDVWKSIVASGYVSVMDEALAKELFQIYGLFDDMNALFKLAMEDNTRYKLGELMYFALSIDPASSTKQSSLGDVIRHYFRELSNSMKRLKTLLDDGR
jgi:hypothetical protein